ncbi:MAG TPA: Ig-like domain-containing protein [Gemmatimonadaceae bacterium]|nr:Ig-like domain-containing protein [Gemmatimonadaceae bacterium]
MVRGLSQVGAPVSLLADTLVALVRDASGLPVPGVAVTWSATDGSVAQLDAITSSDGLARATWQRGVAPAGVATAQSGSATASAYAASDVQRFSSVGDNNRTVCATGVSGGLYCWGEMTNASSVPSVSEGATLCISGLYSGVQCRNAPVRVADSPPFVQIALTFKVGCGLTDQGALWCWGYTASSEPSVTSGCSTVLGGYLCRRPIPALGGVVFAEIVQAGAGICGRTGAGAVWCWGHESNREDRILAPARIDLPQPAVSLAWNAWTSFGSYPPATSAFDAAGVAYSIGTQFNGLPGTGARDLRHFSAGGHSQIIEYGRTECRVTTTSPTVAACTNEQRSCNKCSGSPPIPPFTLAPGGVISALRADYLGSGACAIDAAGALHCVAPSQPTKEFRSPGQSFLALGGARCALHRDRTVRCRGTNRLGELGVGVQGGESYSFSVVRLP